MNHLEAAYFLLALLSIIGYNVRKGQSQETIKQIICPALPVEDGKRKRIQEEQIKI